MDKLRVLVIGGSLRSFLHHCFGPKERCCSAHRGIIAKSDSRGSATYHQQCRARLERRTRAGLAAARLRRRKLATRGRKAGLQQLVNAGKASAARADEFARDVRLLIAGALKATHDNYTQAAAQLNEDGHRSAEGKLWNRRSVAAVVRRLRRLRRLIGMPMGRVRRLHCR